MKVGQILRSHEGQTIRRGHHSPLPGSDAQGFQVSSSIFLIISSKTRRLLYVGESMHASLGYATVAFLGGKWNLVTAIVVEEYRRSFTLAIGEYLQGRSRLPSLIKMRTASGRIVDCEISSFALLSGQASECVVTCRFVSATGSAAVKTASRREDAAAAFRAEDGPQPEAQRDIARELHDTVAQDLFLCKGRLIALREASGERKRARFLAEALGYLDESTTSFRGVLSSFSVPRLATPDLKSELMGVTRWARHRYGLDVTLRVKANLHALGRPACDLLLSSARELLTNVFKHSGQLRARVVVRPEGSGTRLDVMDFGTGTTLAQLEPSRRATSGLGLSGIRERAEQLGGTIEVDSGAGTRTRVSVIIPSRGRP